MVLIFDNIWEYYCQIPDDRNIIFLFCVNSDHWMRRPMYGGPLISSMTLRVNSDHWMRRPMYSGLLIPSMTLRVNSDHWMRRPMYGGLLISSMTLRVNTAAYLSLHPLLHLHEVSGAHTEGPHTRQPTESSHTKRCVRNIRGGRGTVWSRASLPGGRMNAWYYYHSVHKSMITR